MSMCLMFQIFTEEHHSSLLVFTTSSFEKYKYLVSFFFFFYSAGSYKSSTLRLWTVKNASLVVLYVNTRRDAPAAGVGRSSSVEYKHFMQHHV